jgi:6-phosphofructokinase 1
MPKTYIAADGFGITPAARRYLAPLIRGEDYPPYDRDGLPKYVRMKKVLVRKKLPEFDV